MMKWCAMNKAQRAIYRQYREELLAMEADQLLWEAEKREMARLKAVRILREHGSIEVSTLDVEYTKKVHCEYFGHTFLHIPPKLNLVVEAFESTLAFRVDIDFRRAVGILLPKRRALIRRAMPPSVELFLGIHPKYSCDNIYISPEIVVAWVDRASALIRPSPCPGSA